MTLELAGKIELVDFISKNLNELDFDVIISFKEGGSILGQALETGLKKKDITLRKFLRTTS